VIGWEAHRRDTTRCSRQQSGAVSRRCEAHCKSPRSAPGDVLTRRARTQSPRRTHATTSRSTATTTCPPARHRSTTESPLGGRNAASDVLCCPEPATPANSAVRAHRTPTGPPTTHHTPRTLTQPTPTTHALTAIDRTRRTREQHRAPIPDLHQPRGRRATPTPDRHRAASATTRIPSSQLDQPRATGQEALPIRPITGVVSGDRRNTWFGVTDWGL
jgi:hypothetical protein